MRKLHCFLLALTCAPPTYGQVILNMLEPQNVAGAYQISWATAAYGWGTADLNDPANSVTDTLVFVDDGTVADSLGCNALVNGADVNGKIAVIYRGTCAFSVKAMNAQDQGAVAVIIISNNSGAPGPMGSAPVGANVTIPVVMISDVHGALLRQAILDGNAVGFIGSVADLYPDDVGFFHTDVLLPMFGANPTLLSQNGSEYNFDLGVWLNNYGSNDQSGITVTAEVMQDGSSVFSITSDPIDLLSNDSLFVDLGVFQMASYSGDYTLTYTADMPATDAFEMNNTYTATFSFGELFSYARVDFNTHLPISDTHLGGSTTQPYRTCVHFRDANASRVAVPGIWFSVIPTVAGTPIVGEPFEIGIYEWTDVFTGMGDVPLTIPSLDLLQVSDLEHPDTPPGEMVYAAFYAPLVELEDNKRYLFCVSTFSPLFRLGYNSVLNYDRNLSVYDQPTTLYHDGDDWWVFGFAGGGSSSIGVVMLDAATIGMGEHEDAPVAAPYPNPATDRVRIPLRTEQAVSAVELLSAEGTVVRTLSGGAMNKGQLELDVHDLSRGAYLARLLFTDGARTTFRVVLSR